MDGTRNRSNTLLGRVLSYFLISQLMFPGFAVQAVYGEIVADPNADIAFKPKVRPSSSVPVVDIVAPDTQGISHNRYQSFNVDTQGAVLNNSQVGAISRLAGELSANPNLTGATASTILNEITSLNDSQLRGMLEIFGDKANVIIANRNGITCDGCGFINTQRATLTTGTPRFVNGKLELDVDDGTIALSGDGYSYRSRATQFDVLSRYIDINSDVFARQRLNLIAGRLIMNYSDSLNKTSLKDSIKVKTDKKASKRELAIDASAFGAVQAGRIEIMGTEQGLGVKTDAYLYAQVDDLFISSAGGLDVRDADAVRNIQLHAKNDLNIHRDLNANNRISAQANNVTLAEKSTLKSANTALTAAQKATTNGSIKTLELETKADQASIGGKIWALSRFESDARQTDIQDAQIQTDSATIKTQNALFNRSKVVANDLTVNTHKRTTINDSKIETQKLKLDTQQAELNASKVSAVDGNLNSTQWQSQDSAVNVRDLTLVTQSFNLTNDSWQLGKAHATFDNALWNNSQLSFLQGKLNGQQLDSNDTKLLAGKLQVSLDVLNSQNDHWQSVSKDGLTQSGALTLNIGQTQLNNSKWLANTFSLTGTKATLDGVQLAADSAQLALAHLSTDNASRWLLNKRLDIRTSEQASIAGKIQSPTLNIVAPNVTAAGQWRTNNLTIGAQQHAQLDGLALSTQQLTLNSANSQWQNSLISAEQLTLNVSDVLGLQHSNIQLAGDAPTAIKLNSKTTHLDNAGLSADTIALAGTALSLDDTTLSSQQLDIRVNTLNSTLGNNDWTSKRINIATRQQSQLNANIAADHLNINAANIGLGGEWRIADTTDINARHGVLDTLTLHTNELAFKGASSVWRNSKLNAKHASLAQDSITFDRTNWLADTLAISDQNKGQGALSINSDANSDIKVNQLKLSASDLNTQGQWHAAKHINIDAKRFNNRATLSSVNIRIDSQQGQNEGRIKSDRLTMHYGQFSNQSNGVIEVNDHRLHANAGQNSVFTNRGQHLVANALEWLNGNGASSRYQNAGHLKSQQFNFNGLSQFANGIQDNGQWQAGTLTATKALHIGDIDFVQRGNIVTKALTIDSRPSFSNWGDIHADTSHIKVSDRFDNHGNMHSQQLSLATNTLTNHSRISANVLGLNTHTLSNSGQLLAKDLTATTNKLHNQQNGLINATHSTVLSGKTDQASVINEGRILQNEAHNNQQQSINPNATFVLNRFNRIDNQGVWHSGQLSVTGAGSDSRLTNQGKLYVEQALQLHQLDHLNNQGDNSQLLSQTLNWQQGKTLTNQGKLSVEQSDVAVTRFDNQGHLNAKQLTLKSQTLSNQGTVTAQQFNLSGQRFDNQGRVNANSAQWLLSQALNNSGDIKQLTNNGNIGWFDISAHAFNNQVGGKVLLTHGKLNLNTNGQRGTFTNRGLIEEVGSNNASHTLNLIGINSLTNQGQIITQGMLDTHNLDNQGNDSVIQLSQYQGNLNRLSNQGLLQTQGNLHLTTQQFNNSGRILSGGALALTHNGQLNTHGRLEAQKALTLNAHGLHLGHGGVLLSASGDSQLSVGQRVLNQGTIQLAGNSRLNAGGIDNQHVIQGQSLTLNSTGGVANHSHARIDTTNALTLNSAQLNNAGHIVSNGVFNLTTGVLDNHTNASLSANQGGLWRFSQFSNHGKTLSGGHLHLGDGSHNAGRIDNHGGLYAHTLSVVTNADITNHKRGKLAVYGGSANISGGNVHLTNHGGLFTRGGLNVNINGNLANHGNMVIGKSVSGAGAGSPNTDSTIKLGSGKLINHAQGQADFGNLTVHASAIENQAVETDRVFKVYKKEQSYGREEHKIKESWSYRLKHLVWKTDTYQGNINQVKKGAFNAANLTLQGNLLNHGDMHVQKDAHITGDLSNLTATTAIKGKRQIRTQRQEKYIGMGWSDIGGKEYSYENLNDKIVTNTSGVGTLVVGGTLRQHGGNVNNTGYVSANHIISGDANKKKLQQLAPEGYTPPSKSTPSQGRAENAHTANQGRAPSNLKNQGNFTNGLSDNVEPGPTKSPSNVVNLLSLMLPNIDDDALTALQQGDASSPEQQAKINALKAQLAGLNTRVTPLNAANAAQHVDNQGLQGGARKLTSPSAPSLFDLDPSVLKLMVKGTEYALTQDYLFGKVSQQQLGDTNAKLFVDPYQEAQLIKQAALQQTGKAYFSPDWNSSLEQRKALYDNTLAHLKANKQLKLGTALTTNQINALQKPVIWYIDMTIGGEKKRLPTVYLPNATLAHITTPQAGSLNTQKMDIAANTFKNTGNINASGDARVDAQHIINQTNVHRTGTDQNHTSKAGDGGNINANNLVLNSQTDIDNNGGSITTQGDLSMDAKNNINLNAIQLSNRNGDTRNYHHSVKHTTSTIKAGGNANFTAANTFTSQGADVSATGSLSVAANDIDIGGVKDRTDSRSESEDSGMFSSSSQTREHTKNTFKGSKFKSGKDIKLTANNKLTLTGSTMDADGRIKVKGKNITITAGISDENNLSSQSNNGFVKNKQERSGHFKQTGVASALNGKGGIDIDSNGGDVSILGSTLASENNIQFGTQVAKRDKDGNIVTDENGQYVTEGGGGINNLTIGTVELKDNRWHEKTEGYNGVFKIAAKVASTAMALTGKDNEIELSKTERSDTKTTTHQRSSVDAGGSVNAVTNTSIKVVGSGVKAKNNSHIQTKEFALLEAKNRTETTTSTTTETFGAKGARANKEKKEITVLSTEDTTHTERTTTTDTTVVQSSFNVGGNTSIHAKTMTARAANVDLKGDADINVDDINITGVNEDHNSERTRTTDTTTSSVGVKNAYVDTAFAAKAVYEAGEAVNAAKKALADARRRIKNGTLAASALDDYKANLAAATAQLGQASLAAAQSGATAAASTASAGFYASASASHTHQHSQSTHKQQRWVGSTFNIGGNANVKGRNGKPSKQFKLTGSQFNVAKKLTLDADHIDVRSGQEHSSHRSNNSSQTVGMDVSNSGGVGVNASANNGTSQGQSTHHILSGLNAGSMDSTSKTFNVHGGKVNVQGQANVTTHTLTVTSVQDTASHQNHSKGANISGGTGGISSVGANASQGKGKRKWTTEQSSFLVNTRGKAKDSGQIKAKHTQLNGGIIASAQTDENGQIVKDNGDLNLSTQTIGYRDIKDSDTQDQKGINLHISTARTGDNPNTKADESYATGSSTLGAQHTGHAKKQTTLATLGGGNIHIGGKQQSDADLKKQGINTDATQTQKLTKNQQTGGLDATVTVDHRLASEQGRQQIANDVQDTYEHGEDIYRAAASEGTGIADKVSAVHQNAQLTQLKNDLVRNPDNAQLLADLNSQDPDTKAQAMVQVAKMAQAKFGIAPKDLNLYDSKKTTSGSLKDNALSDVKGATVTDKNNSQYGQAFVDVGDNASEQDIANTMGHETSEQINLAKGGSHGLFGKRDEQSAEAMNNAFGNQFADRLNQATGNTLSGTGSNFKGTKTAQNGTQAANQVGNASVRYRQFHTAEKQKILNGARQYAQQQGYRLPNGQVDENRAVQELSTVALRKLDNRAKSTLDDSDLDKKAAEKYLGKLGLGEDIVDENGKSTGQKLFQANEQQKENSLINTQYADSHPKIDKALNQQSGTNVLEDLLVNSALGSSTVNTTEALQKIASEQYNGNVDNLQKDVESLVPMLDKKYQYHLKKAQAGDQTSLETLGKLSESLKYTANILNNKGLKNTPKLKALKDQLNQLTTTYAFVYGGSNKGSSKGFNNHIPGRTKNLVEVKTKNNKGSDFTSPTRDSIQTKLNKLPDGQGANYHVRQNSDGSFSAVRNDVNSTHPIKVTDEGNIFTPINIKKPKSDSLSPQDKGRILQERRKAEEIAKGNKVTEEVTLELSDGKRTKVDLFVEEANGKIKCIECKNGPYARLTDNQKQAKKELPALGATTRGGNADKTSFGRDTKLENLEFEVDMRDIKE